MQNPGIDRRRASGRTIAIFLFALLVANAAPLFAQCTSNNDTTVCAAGIFCTGFEEANPKAQWNDFDGNPDSTNLVMVDTGPCNVAGNRVMRLRAPAGTGQAADLVKVLPSSHDKLYARWYVKWESNYSFNSLNHGGGLFAGDRGLLGQSGNRPTGADWYTGWFEPIAGTYNGVNLSGKPHLYTYYRGMYQQCGSQGNCFGDSLPCQYDEGSFYCTKPQHRETVTPPTLVTNRWYCVEVLLDGGTPTATATGANGVQNFWVDDVQYGPWNDLWLRTTSNLKVNHFWINLYHHNTHPDAGFFVDDVVVSTQRIGCHGGGTSVPGKPTNLRVIPPVLTMF